MGISSNSITCDGPRCEQVKKETNHWFVCWVFEGQFKCIRNLDTSQIKTKNIRYACGQECAHKLFGKFLATGEL